MNRTFITLLSCAALALSASALELTVTPGSLQSSVVLISSTRDKTCKLTGEANTEDLALLKNISTHVYELDLSELTVLNDEIPDYFIFDTNVSRVVLPTGIKKIGKLAFAATSVKILTLPETLESIGDYAYSGCTQLQGVSIPNSVELGTGVFKDCTALNLVKFTESPAKLSNSLFEGCSALNFTIPEGVTEIGNRALRLTATTTADLQNVTKVGDFAFADCSKLSSIIMNATNNIAFGNGVFFLDKSISEIPSWTGNLPNLFAAEVSAKIPQTINVEIVGEGAYANNATTTIDSIAFGSAVKEIKAYAFRNFHNLNSIDVTMLGSSVPVLDEKAFSGLEDEDGTYKNITLNVAKNTQSVWQDDAVWSLFSINESTGVENVAEASSINIERNGNNIAVSADQPISSFSVFTVGGVQLYNSSPMALEAVATDIDADIVIVRVQAGSSIKVSKIF